MADKWESDEFLDEIVIVTKGKYKDRIGYCDEGHTRTKCIIYFGHMLIAFQKYYLVSYKSLRKANTQDLLNRRNWIESALIEGNIFEEDRSTLLEELILIRDTLNESVIRARFFQAKTGKKVFISHSFKDKSFAKKLAMDLSNEGHYPWMDDLEILAGDSIPNKIAVGIKDCDFVLVILSKHSVNSNWVEREWEAKYWDEVQAGKVKVIPILYEECDIPQLLKTKKYANFVRDYADGLDEILLVLNRKSE